MKHQNYLKKLVEQRIHKLIINNSHIEEEVRRRKQAEEFLKLERSRLLSVLDSLPVLICLQRPDYSIAFANKFFWNRFGKAGVNPCYTIIHNRMEPCEQCPVLKVFETGSAQQWEWTAPDGRIYQANAYPFRDIDGSDIILYFSLDITERKRAEAALRYSEEKFSKAFRSSPDAITITTLEEGLFVDVNDSFIHVTGYDRPDILGRSVCDLKLIEQKERETIIQMLMENGIFQNYEINFRIRSGEIRTGLLSAEVLDIEGKSHILCVSKDITERKRIDKEMARLERLNLIGQIAASIGHEIRNPITTVRGFLQILRSTEESMDKIDYFDLMLEELDRVNSIITEFLSLARNKAVKLEGKNLNRIITAVLPLIQASAMVKEHKVRIDLAPIPDMPLDEKEMRQLLLNLARNGLEAMPTGGT